LEQLSPRTAAVGQATFGQLVYFFSKRIADIVGGSLLLVLLSPLLLTVALVIWLDSGLPIIYRCQRLGRYGQPITVFKFRTMRDGSHKHLEELLTVDEERRLEYGLNRKLKDDPRRTRVGAFLRRASLDELPQLWNVVRGEMSLIGPRPEQVELVERYLPEHRFRLLVRPGITGPMQVFGRGELTFEERFAVEREYIENLSLGRDVRILALTASAVAHAKVAY
jgi:lipopolysaccharide/colanic/teichoic acid biosynthesis glycosyltransferase